MLKKRISAAFVDFSILNILWVLYTIVIYIIISTLDLRAEDDVVRKINVIILLVLLFTILIFPFILLYIKDIKLPGYGNQKLALVDKDHQPISPGQRMIKLGVVFLLTLCFIVLEIFLWSKIEKIELIINELMNLFYFTIYLFVILNLAFHLSYILLFYIEMFSGVNLPNKLAKIQVVEREDEKVEL